MRKNVPFIIIAAIFLALCGIGLSLFVGAIMGYDSQVFWLLRVPRTISAIAVGGGLAVAGVLIQASFGNPLAEPYTIGIASAAALGAVVGALVKEFHLLSSGAVAFMFAMGAMFMLMTWLRRSFRHASEVLLAGVVLGFFFTSLATLLMALTDPATWSSTIVWLFGTLGKLSLGESVATLFLMIACTSIGWLHWKALDLVSVDELTAESAGVDVAQVRGRLFILVALITATCVSVAGVIGFLGLIVPHTLRKLGLRGHFGLIPVSFVSGAGLLLCADVAARMVARPSEIPVGVILAIIGAPFFLMLARAERSVAT